MDNQNNDKINFDLEFWQESAKHPRLGEILLQHRKINLAQLEVAIDLQKNKDLPIGEIFIQMGIITKNELIEVLELQTNIDRMLKQSFDELKKLKENG